MTRTRDLDEGLPERAPGGLSVEQLRAYENGWAATIMPTRNGWKIHYFSIPDFEEEPGTLFSSFDEAVEALCQVLPRANSAEQKAKARKELKRLEAGDG